METSDLCRYARVVYLKINRKHIIRNGRNKLIIQIIYLIMQYYPNIVKIRQNKVRLQMSLLIDTVQYVFCVELLCRVNLTNVSVQRTEVPYCRAALVPIVKAYLCDGVALRPHGFNIFYCFSIIYEYVSGAILAGPQHRTVLP